MYNIYIYARRTRIYLISDYIILELLRNTNQCLTDECTMQYKLVYLCSTDTLQCIL